MVVGNLGSCSSSANVNFRRSGDGPMTVVGESIVIGWAWPVVKVDEMSEKEWVTKFVVLCPAVATDRDDVAGWVGGV